MKTLQQTLGNWWQNEMERHLWECDKGRSDEIRVWFYDRIAAVIGAVVVARFVGTVAGFEAPMIVVLGALAFMCLHHRGAK